MPQSTPGVAGRRLAAAALAAACLAVTACRFVGRRIDSPAISSDTATVPAAESGQAFVLVGAGDIAGCGWPGDEATAALLDSIPGTVFTTGDNAYESGTAREFARCYAPSWGRHKDRTRPSPGNHDYRTRGAAGYYAYYGDLAGPAGRGWYSYDLGAWHIVVFNSAVDIGADSPQLAWLRADLAANTSRCLLAYGHHPRFSSGSHGGVERMRAIWDALYAARADVVLAGHDHIYERFAPQDPAARADPQRGIRQFIVGTGGAALYRVRGRAANSEAVNTSTRGVLALTLRDGGYSWRFVPIRGGTFTDAGRGTCNQKP